MKKEQKKAEWEQVKTRALESWGELTEEDFASAGGSTDKLYNVIKEKYNESEDSIKTRLYGVTPEIIPPKAPANPKEDTLHVQ